jgi:hypothetical protein
MINMVEEDNDYLYKKPTKTEELKIINYMNSKYATFDGKKIWEIDDIMIKLLEDCDGEKTFMDIVEKVSQKSGISTEELKIGLKKLFKELENMGFIKLV